MAFNYTTIENQQIEEYNYIFPNNYDNYPINDIPIPNPIDLSSESFEK